MTSGVRRWVAGVGLAGGAAVAATMIGTSVARADSVDDFLLQAEGDMSQVSGLLSSLDGASLSGTEASGLEGAISGIESQSDLISQIQTQQDSFSEALQTGSQLLTADQQLADASGDLVAATQTFVNAFNAGDLPLSDAATFADRVTGLEAGFGFLYAELFQALPAELNAGLDTIADGGTLDFASISPELAAGAAAGATDPATLLSEGTADLTEANAVLSGIDLTGQPSDIASLIPTSTEIIGSQEQLQAAMLNIQNMIVDTQMQGSSMPGYDLVTEATNALFTNADQDLLTADAGLLASDQLLAGAISSGAGFTDLDSLQSAAAILGTAGADLTALGTSFDAAFTPFLELFSAF
jgi:hypothetical protein